MLHAQPRWPQPSTGGHCCGPWLSTRRRCPQRQPFWPRAWREAQGNSFQVTSDRETQPCCSLWRVCAGAAVPVAEMLSSPPARRCPDGHPLLLRTLGSLLPHLGISKGGKWQGCELRDKEKPEMGPQHTCPGQRWSMGRTRSALRASRPSLTPALSTSLIDGKRRVPILLHPGGRRDAWTQAGKGAFLLSH